MRIALYAWRATWRRSWQTALTVALIGGLLGAVALAALAGARRTDSAYSRYLVANKVSDVMIDIPGPLLSVVRKVEGLPGTISAKAWLGLNGQPVINGKVDDSFQTDAIAVSLDGEYFTQDKLTVLAGTLPSLRSSTELAVTQPMAHAFHLHPGSPMTWQFTPTGAKADGTPLPGSHDDGVSGPAYDKTFIVTAIVAMPPALGDSFDDIDGALLPPAAAPPFLLHTSGGNHWVGWSFGWVALRLRDGDAGVPAIQRQLDTLSDQQFGGQLPFNIRRLAVVKREAQQAIEPQALALAILGGLAMIALLTLMTQGLAQLLTRSAADAPAPRAMGASRLTSAIATAAWGAVAVAGSVVIAVAGAIAASPLAPIGPVRLFDPARGVQVDWLVIGGGAAILLLVLAAVLALLAWRAVRHQGEIRPVQPSALVRAAIRSGLPVTVVAGIRHVLERGSGRLRAPVRATLTGSVVAVTALVAALVFGASLTSLVHHPAKYGWDWGLVIQSQGGWGSWPPGALDHTTVASQQGVTGWAELGFAQIPLDGTEVPAMGLLQHIPAHPVEPPTTSGHPLTGPDQIELGTITMRQLGLRLGDKVHAGADKHPLTIVGTVTLPSVGVVLTDHVSLGRGAMMNWTTMMSVLGLPATASGAESIPEASPAYPATVAFDLSSPAAGRHLIDDMAALSAQTGSPGGTYPLYAQQELGAAVVNASQMGSQPVVFAIGVAAAALLALGLTILASVRQRRRELALLKSLGLSSRQIRAIVAWQTCTILAIAVIAGIPLGIAAGRWAWTTFANTIGVVPTPVVPGLSLLAGVVLLLLAGNALASVPAWLAARIPPAATLRTE
jgi:hypothetical protein